MESYSVEAVLKASGANKFSNDFKNATKHVQGLDRSTDKAGLTIGKLLGAVGVTAAVAKGFQLVRNSVDLAFKRIDTMEQFERVMTTMTGSTEKANEVLEETNQAVLGTAYGLDIGANAVQNFVTSNMEVDTATDTIARWGDAVAFYGDGSNETLSSVSDALAKMSAKGKVQMDNMNRLTERGIPAMQIFADATGKSVEEVSEQMSAGELHADEFITVMNDALKNGTENFASIDGAAKEAGASWSGSFANMRAAVARGVTNIISSIDTMLTDNGLPDMREMVADFGSRVEDILNKVGENLPKVIDRFKEWKDMLEPYAPLIKVIATAFGAFVGVAAIINTLTLAFKALNLTLGLSPIGAIVAAIVASAVLIYVYWEPISEFFLNIWEAIKNAGLAVWEFLQEAWASYVEIFKAVWSPIIDFFIELWETTKETFVSAWEFIKNTVLNIISPFINIIVEGFQGMWDGIKTILDGLKQYMSGVWELIKNVVLGPVLLIYNLVTGNFGDLRDNAIAISDNIKNALQNIWEGIKKMFSGTLKYIVSSVGAQFNFIKTLISNVMSAIWNGIKSSWNNIKSIFSSVVGAIGNIISRAFTGYVNMVRNQMNLVKSTITNIWNSVMSFFRGISLRNIGKNLIKGFTSGISSMFNSVKSTISKITSFVPSTIKKVLGIRSPSVLFRAFGVNLFEGFNLGMEDEEGAVTKTVGNIADRVKQAFNPELDIANRVSGINSGFQNHMTVEHTNSGSNAMISLLERIANSEQVIVLDTGELVGGTYNEYDRVGGSQLELSERWGR